METRFMKHPPAIVHWPFRPSGFERIVKKASKNLSLSGRETKLLALYAGQANGFRPTLKFIQDRTGIADNKVSEIRKGLVRRGLICHDKDASRIYINWERLILFAGLRKPLKKHASLYGNFSPWDAQCFKREELKIWEIHKMESANRWQWGCGKRASTKPCKLTKKEKGFIKKVENMTESECIMMFGGCPAAGETSWIAIDVYGTDSLDWNALYWEEQKARTGECGPEIKMETKVEGELPF